MITRRQFNRGMAVTLLGALLTTENNASSRLRVAALQMQPKLADVESNLVQAERLIKQAIGKGAQWIVLPELFTSAAAFHQEMLKAIRPLDGAPAKMMADLSRRHGVVIGGSFLASRAGEVYNSFLLSLPDGRQLRHDKDIPTYWERCFYRGGSDDGVLTTPQMEVGAALCWEMIRTRTLQRLKGRVRLLLGASCWWTLSDEVATDHPFRVANLKMLQDAPVRCSRLLGVPVVHASHAGVFNGFFSPDLPDVSYNSHYLGESVIVDHKGQVIARRDRAEGAGVVIAEIELPATVYPQNQIPDRYWLPQEMPAAWKAAWERWRKSGARYYQTVTLPYLRQGVINEFVPAYML